MARRILLAPVAVRNVVQQDARREIGRVFRPECDSPRRPRVLDPLSEAKNDSLARLELGDPGDPECIGPTRSSLDVVGLGARHRKDPAGMRVDRGWRE